jgi:putative transposase
MGQRERSRRRAYNEPGHAYELTFTCYRRYRFLSAERTCRWLAEAIEAARERLDFALWAFVFMPEHAHVIVWPRRPEYEVSAILGAIKEPVGRAAVKYLESHAPQWLPRLTRCRGRRTERLFWQSGGGFDRNICAPATLMAMMAYLHLNPVRRGLVERAADWRWSSAGWWFDGVDRCGLIPDAIPPEWVPRS